MMARQNGPDALPAIPPLPPLPAVPQQTPVAPTPPTAPTAPVVVSGGETPAPGVITIQRNGKTITIDGATGGASGGGDVFSGTGFPNAFDLPPNIYNLAKDGIIGFTLMIVAFPVFGFLKALVNRSASRQSALPARDTTDRLLRIEAAVEAMSVEVERISEGQRFVTRVLSERSTAQT